MRLLSLCTGIAGLDMAVEAHFGTELIAYAELEKSVLPVLERTYPGVPNLGNIKEIDWATLPPVDIITAGYPCQPFSVAGLRKGTDDPRWDEWVAEKKAQHKNGNGHGKSLSIEMLRLPTPTARDYKDGAGTTWHPEKCRLPHSIGVLPTPTEWGQYGAAIVRHEQMLGRSAPEPREDGKLSPTFVEWMMGYTEGHTAGLTRANALKALGNAVMPQQAAAALRELCPL